MPIDPVCGAEVPKEAKWRAEYGGQVYYFCCKHCLERFLREPSRYVR